MALIDIQVPDIGDFDQVTVIELLVRPGDTVKAEQSLITVESDKASMEIPSSQAGVVQELRVALGDKVAQGSVVLVLEAAEAAAPVRNATPLTSLASAPTALVAASHVPVPPATEGPAGSMELRVPDIGDFRDVTVIEVLVEPGASIKLEQSLLTVESDKASMEIPSSLAGTLVELHVKVGDKINIGDLLGVVQGVAGNNAVASAPAASAVHAAPSPASVALPLPAAPLDAPQAVGQAPASVPAHHPAAPLSSALPHASPSVRRFARMLGVPLDEVRGSGPKGRITDTDVQAFTRSVMAGSAQTKAAAAASTGSSKASGASDTQGAALGLLPWPKVDFARFGATERRELSRIRKISGANLHRNWVMIPHVTNHDDADITDLEAFRVRTNKENEKSGTKVTMLAFLIKACVAALRKFPEFNSSLDGEQLVLKKYYNLGFAADTPNGLMVPVIRDADHKGVLQISQEMSELAGKAREGKLSPAEMSGASFTISSLGGIGGRYFTPIINAPEVAILGVCRSTTEPVWSGTAFEPRLMLPLSLSWDHRVIDGAAAARFNAYLAQILGDFRRVLL